jgi:hypothetical protein
MNMKKALFTLTFVVATMTCVFAQGGSLTFFSQNGERFYVILDGIRQNNTPSTNVKVTDLTRPQYKAKIIFEDPSLPAVDKNVYIQDFESKAYMDVVYNVRKNKSGTMDMRMSSVSEASSTSAASAQNVVKYHAEETKQPDAVKVAEPVKTGTATTTTQTTNVGVGTMGVNTSATVKETGENVSINIDMGGLGVGTNVTTTTTTTTTHTTTTKTTDPAIGQPTPKPVTVEQPVVKEAGCTKAISATDFASGKSSIKNQSFSDSQMKVAKTFTKNNCLSVSQVKEIMGLFSFEQSKLEYAKYAYDFCVDKKNYYQLSDAFSFSSSSDDLNNFLETK